MKFALQDIVVTPLGKLGTVIGFTNENNIDRVIVQYQSDTQTVELQPKLLRDV